MNGAGDLMSIAQSERNIDPRMRLLQRDDVPRQPIVANGLASGNGKSPPSEAGEIGQYCLRNRRPSQYGPGFG